MAQSLTIDFTKPMPLFPLGHCLLLPHATVPLHIFEARYRAMVHDVLDSHGLIAMAVFEGEGWKDDYENNPPLRPHVCVGYILRHEQLPDGRYNILVQGICRAKIRQELEHEPYRVALLESTETPATMEIDLEDRRDRIEALLSDPKLGELTSINAIRNWMSREIPTTVLIDLTILALANRTGDRYDMLAQPDADARGRWLEEHLRDTRRTICLADRLGPGKTDEGWHLN